MLTRILWRMARPEAARKVGAATVREMHRPDTQPAMSRLAQCCGSPAGEVRAWLDGDGVPPTGVALSLLAAIDEL